MQSQELSSYEADICNFIFCQGEVKAFMFHSTASLLSHYHLSYVPKGFITS